MPGTQIQRRHNVASPAEARELTQLGQRIRSNLELGRRNGEAMIEAYFAMGRDLLRAKEILPTGRFMAWVEAETNMTQRHAQRLMDAGRREEHVRRILRDQEASIGSVDFNRALQTANTAGGIYRSTESVEWYTSPIIIEAIRAAYGGTIDLDPASNREANRIVRARRFYDEEANGLERPWVGRVFCNPPWGRFAKLFVDKAVEEFRTPGRSNEITMLLSTDHIDSRFFDPLWDHLIYMVGKVGYWHPGMDPQATTPAMHGSVLIYMAARSKWRRFVRTMADASFPMHMPLARWPE